MKNIMKFNTAGKYDIMRKQYLIILILIILSAGCAGRKIVKKGPGLFVPAGIDSSTAAIADSIFKRVLIQEENERLTKEKFKQAQDTWSLADSLWQAKENGLQNAGDSLRTMRQLEEAKLYLKSDKKNFKKLKKLSKKLGSLSPEVITTASNILALKAIGELESAIKLNRFEVNFQLELINYLQSYAQKAGDTNYLIKSADEFEKIIASHKGDYTFFAQLGEIYFNLKDWKKSYQYYNLAEKTLRATSIFEVENPGRYFMQPETTPLDTNLLVAYLYAQARCKMKLYEDKPSLALLREAKQLTPSEEYKKTFQDLIDWILWDAGNIRASEIRDSAFTMEANKEFSNAKDCFLKLLPILWTKRTRDEINWHIATIDYQYLGNKTDGLVRMQQVVVNSETDSLTGAPLDTTYQRYFDTYGIMAFNLGIEYLKSNLEYAYIHFNQAAHTYYKDRGKAFLQLANLSQFDANETIELCEKTLNFEDKLSPSDKKLLYDLFYHAYRKKGDFHQSRKWFDEMKKIAPVKQN